MDEREFIMKVDELKCIDEMFDDNLYALPQYKDILKDDRLAISALCYAAIAKELKRNSHGIFSTTPTDESETIAKNFQKKRFRETIQNFTRLKSSCDAHINSPTDEAIVDLQYILIDLRIHPVMTAMLLGYAQTKGYFVDLNAIIHRGNFLNFNTNTHAVFKRNLQKCVNNNSMKKRILDLYRSKQGDVEK